MATNFSNCANHYSLLIRAIRVIRSKLNALSNSF